MKKTILAISILLFVPLSSYGHRNLGCEERHEGALSMINRMANPVNCTSHFGTSNGVGFLQCLETNFTLNKKSVTYSSQNIIDSVTASLEEGKICDLANTLAELLTATRKK